MREEGIVKNFEQRKILLGRDEMQLAVDHRHAGEADAAAIVRALVKEPRGPVFCVEQEAGAARIGGDPDDRGRCYGDEKGLGGRQGPEPTEQPMHEVPSKLADEVVEFHGVGPVARPRSTAPVGYRRRMWPKSSERGRPVGGPPSLRFSLGAPRAIKPSLQPKSNEG